MGSGYIWNHALYMADIDTLIDEGEEQNMSSGKTKNYGLNQWAGSDQVIRTEFNEDNAKVDEALNMLSERVDNKVDQSVLNTLSSAMPRMAAGTYMGTGSWGSENPTTLDFSDTLGRAPQLVIVRQQNGTSRCLLLLNSITLTGFTLDDNLSGTAYNTLTWSDTKVSWYAQDANTQMNSANYVYCYVAFG